MAARCKFELVRRLASKATGSYAYREGFKDALAMLPYAMLEELEQLRFAEMREEHRWEKPKLGRPPSTVATLDAWRKPS